MSSSLPDPGALGPTARLGIAAGLAGAAVVGGAIFQGQYPTAQLYGRTIHREPSAGKALALTYDDGPNPVETPKLLDLLDRYDAKATFFLIGKWAEREPDLIREAVARGHAIGNHTFTHPSMPAHGAGRIREELNRCKEAVEASGESFSTIDGEALMRPPYGRRRPGTLRVLRDEGYVPVTWSITGYDWREHTSAVAITSRCMKAGEGDVILLHDGSQDVPAKDRSMSVETTEALLEHYSEDGYRLLTVPDLVAAGR